MKTNRWCDAEIKELISDVSLTKSEKEVVDLFDVILTSREINDMAKRLKIKKMLEEGKPYSEIENRLLVSPAIISRISSHIGYGFRRSYAVVGEKPKIKKQKDPKAFLTYKRYPQTRLKDY